MPPTPFEDDPGLPGAADQGSATPARRPRCARCTRPLPTCLCAWLRPTDNRLPVRLLQHPLEALHAKGSATLLTLSLARCAVQVGEHFDQRCMAAWLAQGRPLLLYPAVPGRDLAPPSPGAPLANPADWQLVVLDGTWRQARQLLRDHALLQALPRWPLPALSPSAYTIRRAQRPGQLATLEAVCTALGMLEGRPAHYAPLQAAFAGWVATLAARQKLPARS